MKQQVKDGICQSIGKIHDDTRMKMKGEVKLSFTKQHFLSPPSVVTLAERKGIYLVIVLESEKDFPHMWWNMKTRN
jgi:hypothetical protein